MPDPRDTLPTDESDQMLSDLYQQSRKDPMDTTALDQKILSAAREELAAAESAKVARLSGWRRWSAPFAAAASLLLGVSVIINIVLFLQVDDATTYKLESVPMAGVDMSALEISRDQEAAKEISYQPAAKAKRPEIRKRSKAAEPVSQVQSSMADEQLEEVVVTGSRLLQEQSTTPQLSITPQLQQRIEEIIALLEAGNIIEAKKQLDQLLKEHPELQ